MCPTLKLSRHNEKQEIEFELRYLLSLSTRKRFEMMFQKTKEMIRLLEKHGHRKPFQVIKRDKKSADKMKDVEFEYLKRLTKRSKKT